MKSLLDKLVEFFDSIGRARAAAELSRLGHYKAAQRLINGETLV